MSTLAVDWRTVRREFPALANWTFLNTATFGQLSRRCTEAVARHYTLRDETACADFLDWFDDADRIRRTVARLINCAAEDVAFVPNASHALSIVFNGMEWRAGDRIITLAGEFPNNIYNPAVMSARGAEFVETPWERFGEEIARGARLVLVSSVNYTTGFRPPLAELSAMLRNWGTLLFVDGTQSIGALRFDCAEVQPDFLAVHGYKWLLSPTGAGFFYVRPEARQWLRPTVIGWRSDKRWRSVDALHHGAPEFVQAAEKYEGGMLNFGALYGMGASVEMMAELGTDVIERRVLELAAEARGILERAGARVLH
ncbi:MAG TPA: aminotransferase class V-fold PLP-dependent enzyme, partial [Bryobacteraceae bacterium]|nr:aminotransferase class V-fold PLP-dependent enzyme [Bryobacteraceae bacterium]